MQTVLSSRMRSLLREAAFLRLLNQLWSRNTYVSRGSFPINIGGNARVFTIHRPSREHATSIKQTSTGPRQPK